MADEYIDILNKDGTETGIIKLKSEAHQKGLYHKSAHLWLYTCTGKVLIQQRAMGKDTFPGLWDISVAGHIATGETALSAIIREAKEEIGITLNDSHLKFLKVQLSTKKPAPKIIDNEFQHLFIAEIAEETTLKLQTEEVIATKFLTLNDFKEFVMIKKPKSFVPHGVEYYHYIAEAITANLSLS